MLMAPKDKSATRSATELAKGGTPRTTVGKINDSSKALMVLAQKRKTCKAPLRIFCRQERLRRAPKRRMLRLRAVVIRRSGPGRIRIVLFGERRSRIEQSPSCRLWLLFPLVVLLDRRSRLLTKAGSFHVRFWYSAKALARNSIRCKSCSYWGSRGSRRDTRSTRNSAGLVSAGQG